MPDFEISEKVVARAVRRRGQLHMYKSIDPMTTALLVIDLQRAFMTPGLPADLPSARAIVPNVNRLATALRTSGGRVVWIRHAVTEESDRNWPLFLRNFSDPTGREHMRKVLAPGSEGHGLFDELLVDPNDLVVDKTKHSAFIEGSSNLNQILRNNGIETVVVTGAVTNVCCESTARDAMMLNYEVHFVSDGTASRSLEEQLATLNNMALWYADVRSTSEVIDLLTLDGQGDHGVKV